MAEEKSDVQLLVTAICASVDEVLRSRPMEPLKVVSALGGAAALIVGTNIAASEGILDRAAHDFMSLAFHQIIHSVRQEQANSQA